MIEYAYKLVSLKLNGLKDLNAIARAYEKGWEPVPLDEMPVPAINPLDMTPRQLENFGVYRMPKDKRDAVVAERETLNRGLNGRWTPSLMLTFKTSRTWPIIGTVLQHRVVDEDTGEELFPEIRLDEDMLAGAKLAYDWLNKRGLA